MEKQNLFEAVLVSIATFVGICLLRVGKNETHDE